MFFFFFQLDIHFPMQSGWDEGDTQELKSSLWVAAV